MLRERDKYKYCLLAFLGLVGGFSPAVQAADILAARIWESPDSTRVVFDLSDNVDYKTFTLDKPNRLVLDFKSANLGRTFSVPSTVVW